MLRMTRCKILMRRGYPEIGFRLILPFLCLYKPLLIIFNQYIQIMLKILINQQNTDYCYQLFIVSAKFSLYPNIGLPLVRGGFRVRGHRSADPHRCLQNFFTTNLSCWKNENPMQNFENLTITPFWERVMQAGIRMFRVSARKPLGSIVVCVLPAVPKDSIWDIRSRRGFFSCFCHFFKKRYSFSWTQNCMKSNWTERRCADRVWQHAIGHCWSERSACAVRGLPIE